MSGKALEDFWMRHSTAQVVLCICSMRTLDMQQQATKLALHDCNPILHIVSGDLVALHQLLQSALSA